MKKKFLFRGKNEFGTHQKEKLRGEFSLRKYENGYSNGAISNLFSLPDITRAFLLSEVYIRDVRSEYTFSP